jgi:hypothetical protein
MHQTRYLCRQQQNATVQQEFAIALTRWARIGFLVTKIQYQGNFRSVIVSIIGSLHNQNQCMLEVRPWAWEDGDCVLESSPLWVSLGSGELERALICEVAACLSRDPD